jgi:hypothetical protein
MRALDRRARRACTGLCCPWMGVRNQCECGHHVPGHADLSSSCSQLSSRTCSVDADADGSSGDARSQDVSLWRRLAKMSSDQGFMRQAIYCYNKVVAANKADLDALWDRAVLYSNVDEPRKVSQMRPPLHFLWASGQQIDKAWAPHPRCAAG